METCDISGSSIEESSSEVVRRFRRRVVYLEVVEVRRVFRVER